MSENLVVDFATDEVEPEQAFEPLPAGKYRVCLVEVEMKKTKDGSGSYLSVRHAVVGGSDQGRVIFGNLNILNKSPVAQEIGRRQLAGLLDAAGMPGERDLSRLAQREVMVTVSIKQDEKYGAKNNVRAYSSVDGRREEPATTTVSTSSKPSWLNKKEG